MEHDSLLGVLTHKTPTDLVSYAAAAGMVTTPAWYNYIVGISPEMAIFFQYLGGTLTVILLAKELYGFARWLGGKYVAESDNSSKDK